MDSDIKELYVIALQNNSITDVKELIVACQIDLLDSFYMGYAVMYSNVLVVELLLKSGFDINIENGYPLYLAYYNKDLKMQQFLLNKGACIHLSEQ
jgi:hypothetical protein